jgi:hypothetical protein
MPQRRCNAARNCNAKTLRIDVRQLVPWAGDCRIAPYRLMVGWSARDGGQWRDPKTNGQLEGNE